MNQFGYAFLGLTAIVAILMSVLAFAVMRFAAGARDTRRHLREGGSETALLSAALQEAVTKLRAQEQAMSKRAVASEQLSGEIVASLTSGLLVVDRSGRVEILNPAGRRLLGLPTGADAATYRDLLASATPLADVIAECLTFMAPVVRREVRIEGPSGESHFGVTVSPLGPGSQPRGVICLFSDLTAVVELEQQLRLKDTLARLGELTAGIAHEFRNGLATIHGYSRLIDPAALAGPHVKYMEGIRQETESLGKVVTNFLNFARPESVSLTRVALEPIARRAADDLRHELPAGLTIEATGEFYDIQGDEVLLRQVFGNLVRNAAEACDGAGIVPAIVIEGHVDRIARTCRVSVDDNGPGIPEPARSRVFQPFFTTRAQGTGLGLAIVQKVVVMHNGRVGIGTSPAGGASIQLTFPIAVKSP